jgi:SAM-dependent methyltransferase
VSRHSRQDREARYWDQRALERGQSQLEAEHEVLAGEPLFRFLEQRVAEAAPACLLDAGCGTGVGTVRLAGHAGWVAGMDVASESLRRARDHAGRQACHNLALVRSPMEALPFRSESFDLVVGYFVLHHLGDLEQGARELARVLKPSGRAWFVETWGRNPLLRMGRRLAGAAGMRLGMEEEQPLGRAELELLARCFRRLELHYPSLDLVKYVHLPLRKLHARAGEGSLTRRFVDRVWPWPVATDAWLHRRARWLRPFGWHVVLELER